MNIDAKNISELLQLIRRQLAVSQEQLARQLSVSYATVNRWENHQNIPSQLARAQLATFCQQMIASGRLVLPDKFHLRETERHSVNHAR